MRRVPVLVPLLAVVLVGPLVAGRPAARTGAQEATPEAIPPVLVAWTEAWDALDPEAVAALYAEDGVHEDVAGGFVARGRAGIAAALGEAMAGIAQSRNEPVGGFRAGDRAVLEYEVTAVDAASGREFSFRGALVAELEGDLIRHSREYYDVASILGQLGLLGGGTPERDGMPGGRL
jgi:uncharacterized protein (TIGR02246 family)